ncbi:UNVERIFIED_CONTAM: hypothetical protein PYX00_008487 [Menopon gallinae]|uniref:Uncharacterized protein n=1 Tax=Menopon gallinae TaxID=328185 RepID=A0AAW2HN82_9NEOP
MPSGNLQQKNVQLLQGQKLVQKKSSSPQIVSKRPSLVCVDYDSLDEETPPSSPHRGDKLDQHKTEKVDEKGEEEEEIRLATDAEGLELLTQENLLNLELEESDEGNGRSVIIIDNSEESTSGLEKYEDNPNGSPTVMEFMDDDLMVYEPIEGMISDVDELVVLEECEVLEAHEIDITNCDVMEIESVEDASENEVSLHEKASEDIRVIEESKVPESADQVEPMEASQDDVTKQKQQIIVRHTRKGKQIVMVKRGQEGKDQRQVVYSVEKDVKEPEERKPIVLNTEADEEKTSEERKSGADNSAKLSDQANDFKKLIEQSEIIIMGDCDNKTEKIQKTLGKDHAKKKLESEIMEVTPVTSEKFADSPLSPDPLHDRVLSPVKVVVGSELPNDGNLNLPDPRLLKSKDKNVKPVPVEHRPEEVNPKVTKRPDEPSEVVEMPITSHQFPDFPEGLASKFFLEANSEILGECNSRTEDRESVLLSPKETEIKKPETDQMSVIKAPKTYEKSKFGKPKIQLSEHDYTHIPGKVESFKKDEDSTENTTPKTQQGFSATRPVVTYSNIHLSQMARKMQETDKGEEGQSKVITEARRDSGSSPTRIRQDPSRPLPTKVKTDVAKAEEKSGQGAGPCPVIKTSSYDVKSELMTPSLSDISCHIAKIDPSVRDIISISKIPNSSAEGDSKTVGPSSSSTTTTVITSPMTAIVATPKVNPKQLDPKADPKQKKPMEDIKKGDGRRKSLDNLGRRKSVEERRRSSESAISRENKRELEQRKQMILEEIKQSQLEKEKLKLEASKQAEAAAAAAAAAPQSTPETKPEVETKTEHDLSDVIDILENIDSTPTRLLNASELQSIEKTQLFENEELEKTPPPKTKPPETQKFDEKINLQTLLSDTGKSDIQVSDLARGLSKGTSQTTENRAIPPANTQSKLAALLTCGPDVMRPKVMKDFNTAAPSPVFEVRKESVPTLESLLEKDVEKNPEESTQEKPEKPKEEKEESTEKTETTPPPKTDTQQTVTTVGNLILSPTSGIFRATGSNVGVPAAKILNPGTGILLSSTEADSNKPDAEKQPEQKANEPQRTSQGIILSSGPSIIQQSAVVSTAITGNQQGILINDRNLLAAMGNSSGVLMTTRILQPVSKNSPSPTRSSPVPILPPGIRQQIITTNYIQSPNRANPVLMRRISTPPPRVRTPPQTQPLIIANQNAAPHQTAVDPQNVQNTYQRTFRAAPVVATASPAGNTVQAAQPTVCQATADGKPRIVVSTSAGQLLASTQLQRLSVNQGLSIPSAVMSTTVNPTSVTTEKPEGQPNFNRSQSLDGRPVTMQRMYGNQGMEPKFAQQETQPVVPKTEPTEPKEEKPFPPNQQNYGNKFPRTDESQNVLLKQLLQNTACAATTTSTTPVTTPLATVPSLEAQLARPVPPTPSSLIPSLLTDQKGVPGSPTQVAKPIRGPAPGKEMPKPAPNVEARRISQSNRTPSREDLLSPTNSTRSSFGLRTPSPITSPQSVPVTVKQEKVTPGGTIPEAEIKKEVPDEKMDTSSTGHMQEQSAADMKKLKRRQYQQKRRQSQGKEGVASGIPKKRARKGSRMEEDYESYTDNLMTQLRQLPPLGILEPVLGRNYNVCSVFGSGDHSKLNNVEIKGTFGNAYIPSLGDYYTTKPFGDREKPLPSSPVSTQRGFYDQEFSVIQLVNDSEEKRLEALLLGNRERDTETPDTIVSSSSPECMNYEPSPRFPALELIKEEMPDEEIISRASPPIPIIMPIPIRLKPGQTIKEFKEMDKENCGAGFRKTTSQVKDGNVTITLTLNSDAAQDILGVLKDLANILHIPPPTSYQIVERTATPPSIKLGLYRNKGKDGKEGAPVDIQSILNGQAKFCRHCDVVILSNMIRKKVSELPFLSEREDITDTTEDLYFCSSSCYMQFSLMHKSPNVNKDKAATVVDHVSQSSCKKQRLSTDGKENSKGPPRDVKKETDVKKPNKGNKYKYWHPGALMPNTRYKRQSERELMEMLFRVGVTLTPSQNSDDTRRCLFCHQLGDGVADGPARLLNFDVDKWVHLNCALWSDDVYETVNGALMNVDNALHLGQTTICSLCNQNGATIHCFKLRCSNVYHLGCAVKDECVFFKNKTTYCPAHVPKNEKDNELTTLSVYRRVYVQRDENRQVATVMHHTDQNHLLRVGSLIFLNVGQLLPHQLPVFHTPNYIYPVGYKIVRFYWSMRRPNKRCKYICSIHDAYGRPEFRILVQEPTYDDIELRDSSPKAVWARILEPLQQLRKDNSNVQIFPRYVSGEDLFGLNEPAVVRVLESLPGVETLTDYKFKYGRNPLLELPLAVNPTGCARSEPRQKNLLPYKRPHTQRTAATSRPNLFSSSLPGLSSEALCPYSKQFVHSKSSQYKKMKLEWRNNVYLARSKIQGLGLYAARDLERHTMVIEYIGEIIRHELSESREKQYEARNRGIYMFRLDEERVIDATISGGLARYINHSCNPNCVAEIVEVDRDLRIIIFAKRRISRGEELAYDYKFDIEDDQHKIPCLCGAPNCRKWMN